jgi:hypothetical protein
VSQTEVAWRAIFRHRAANDELEIALPVNHLQNCSCALNYRL